MKHERDLCIQKKLYATCYIYAHAQFKLRCLAIDLYNTKPDIWQNGHVGRGIAPTQTADMSDINYIGAYRYNKQCPTFDVSIVEQLYY